MGGGVVPFDGPALICWDLSNNIGRWGERPLDKVGFFCGKRRFEIFERALLELARPSSSATAGKGKNLCPGEGR